METCCAEGPAYGQVVLSFARPLEKLSQGEMPTDEPSRLQHVVAESVRNIMSYPVRRVGSGTQHDPESVGEAERYGTMHQSSSEVIDLSNTVEQRSSSVIGPHAARSGRMQHGNATRQWVDLRSLPRVRAQARTLHPHHRWPHEVRTLWTTV